jgi:hypothetical protein
VIRRLLEQVKHFAPLVRLMEQLLVRLRLI